ncbi:MAG: hypothetical protein AABW58_00035 [Nanoarchaeota archaeon]
MNPIKRNKTVIAVHRLAAKGELYYVDSVPYFQGRHIIHKDSPIDGGVSVGQVEREALVVDFNKSKIIPVLYEEAKKASTFRGQIDKDLILTAVFDVVTKRMKTDESKVEKIIRETATAKDRKISIDHFISAGAAVCRQHALVCGVLIERFIKDGYLNGKVSIDRNSVYNNGHVWCRYTSSSGKVLILDPTLKFKGKLEQGLKKGAWCYNRAEDGI